MQFAAANQLDRPSRNGCAGPASRPWAQLMPARHSSTTWRLEAQAGGARFEFAPTARPTAPRQQAAGQRGIRGGADGYATKLFRVLDAPENEKVVSALNALAEGSTELVAVTCRYDNPFQQLKCSLLKKGGDFKLPDGDTIKTVVGNLVLKT